MSAPKHILVFRFSSLGDIAMTVPVIKLLLQQHAALEVTFVSVAFVKPLFDNIERLHFFVADIKGKHKNPVGLYQLYKTLKRQFTIDAVADLHNVLRTQILRVFFSAGGKRIAAIDKGRAEKKMLTRQHNKVLKPLKSTFQRYADVFAALGLPVTLNAAQGFTIPKGKNTIFERYRQQGIRLIGIAPFAQYSEKTYPSAKMQQVIQLLCRFSHVQVLLFGGKQDVPALQQLATVDVGKVKIVAGTMSFAEELAVIAQLHVMVSMDSANMHLASMMGVPVVSIWGGTHPYTGFYGWGQPLGNAVQVDLACRPSSVFGNKPCPRGDLACMERIAPLAVYNKVCEVACL